jgi:hypothetical protein
MRRFAICCAMTALTLSGHAMAQDKLSYNKVEAGLVGASFEDFGDSYGAGIDINGSWEFTPHVFGFGHLGAIAYDYGDSEDISFAFGNLDLGVGFNAPLASSVDVFAGVSWRTFAEAYDYADDEDIFDTENTYSSRGVGGTVGLRGLVGRRFAWDTGLKYAKLDIDERDFKFAITSLKAGFRFHFTRLLGLGVDVGMSSYDSGFHLAADEITVAAMFRFQFDDRDGSPQWK